MKPALLTSRRSGPRARARPKQAPCLARSATSCRSPTAGRATRGSSLKPGPRWSRRRGARP
eukprot:6246207-Lingulodinium_polyedra.AAC.1